MATAMFIYAIFTIICAIIGFVTVVNDQDVGCGFFAIASFFGVILSILAIINFGIMI